jgi:hypothetical protein
LNIIEKLTTLGWHYVTLDGKPPTWVPPIYADSQDVIPTPEGTPILGHVVPELYLDGPFTGMSFSFCVRDIAHGFCTIDQVTRIIAGTKCFSWDDWNGVISQYQETYWSHEPKGCEFVARQLINAGKVFQPRCRNIASRHQRNINWIRTAEFYLIEESEQS